jgi:glycosyltransferase involved in cell wall biosynthesis
MTTLRLVVDQILARVPGGIGRYTLELAKELIATAPTNCQVEGIVSAHLPEKYQELTQKLPGLSSLYTAPIGRRELSRAWQYGLPVALGGGMVHAPSLFAPLRAHDPIDSGEQIAVTIHDVVPWTHPKTLTSHGVAWHKAMMKRAQKYADAIVVPTHAVAEQLTHYYNLGDRVRVIGGAVSPTLRLPANATERAKRLKLPPEYILTVGTLEPRKGISPLIQSLALPPTPALPLLIVGPSGWGKSDINTVAAQAGLPKNRVRALGFLSDEDLAVVFDRATVFVFPSLAEGFGLPVIEAFSFGTPVIHSDDLAVLEVSDGAGFAVERNPAAGYPKRLAAALGTVVGDPTIRKRLSIEGPDRARSFSWHDSAERVWELHADL